MSAVRYFVLRGLIVLAVILSGVVSVGYGRVIYVDDDANGLNDGSSWSNAYKYLQDALVDANSAGKPVDIRVAQGIYKPDRSSAQPNGTGDREATFRLLNSVTLRGGYAGSSVPDPNARDVSKYETILSGDLAGNDIDLNDPCDLLNDPTRSENSCHVVTGSGTDRTALLNGFTIIGGSANAQEQYVGGGMFNEGGSPTVMWCTFKKNVAYIGGGMVNWEGSPFVNNCLFICNAAHQQGGGMNNSLANPTLTKCAFIQNYATSGGAMCNLNCISKVTECIFKENIAGMGGGMENLDGTSILSKCTFIQNHGEKWGGAVTGGGNWDVIGCTFSGNTASGYGGSLTCDLCDLKVTNCTFAGNSAPKGSAVSCSSYQQLWPSRLEFVGCIFRDKSEEIWNDCGSTLTVTYSNVKGGWVGVGNIDADPCFVNPGYWDPNGTPDDPNDDFWVDGDYHLKSRAGRWDPPTADWIKDEVTSPCIDAGDPMSPIGEEPFPNGGRINMGTYGGTVEASKSYFGTPPCETIIAGDINGDCKIDFEDFAILAMHWLEDHTPIGSVKTIYKFLPDQSTMVWHVGRAGWSIHHSVEGQFQLTMDFDAGIARFEQVDAILTNGQPPPTNPGVNLNGQSLDKYFLMTLLTSKDFTHTSAYFEGRFHIENSFVKDVVSIALVFADNTVRLTGKREFSETIPDASAYSLDGIAVMVTEP